MSSFEVYLNALFSQCTPPPNRPSSQPSYPTQPTCLPNYPTPSRPTCLPTYPTPSRPTCLPTYPTPTYPVLSYSPTSYMMMSYSPPTSYTSSPSYPPPPYLLSPEVPISTSSNQTANLPDDSSYPLKPPSLSASQYCSFSSNTSTLETPLYTPEPVATSTPAFPLISPHHITPPRTPGKREMSSPPRFFFPPDFTLPEDTSRDTPSLTPPLQTAPASGKAVKNRRSRTKFTPSQLTALETEFDLCSYITPERRRELSRSLGIKELAIRVWFQNRRTLMKKRQKNLPKQTPA